jgi:uncharacterized protein with NAD-binding domain and iron-sulfur cluster
MRSILGGSHAEVSAHLTKRDEEPSGSSNWHFRAHILPDNIDAGRSACCLYQNFDASQQAMLCYSDEKRRVILAFTDKSWDWNIPDSRKGLKLKPVQTFHLKFSDFRPFEGASPEQLDVFFDELTVKMVAESSSIYAEINDKKSLIRLMSSFCSGRKLTLSDYQHRFLASYPLEGAGQAVMTWAAVLHRIG